jgi:predicted nuclease of predicted toxin-antitoxin system
LKPLDYPFLADENIHPDVVAGLRSRGRNVLTAKELGLGGRPDAEILARALILGRVVLTHDSDFGMLAIARGAPYTGIVILRPGHIAAEFVLAVIQAVAEADLDVAPPFLIVAERRGNRIKVRRRGQA